MTVPDFMSGRLGTVADCVLLGRRGCLCDHGIAGGGRGCVDATDEDVGAALGARVAVLVEKDYQA